MVPRTLPYHFNGMPVGAAYATPSALASGPSKICSSRSCISAIFFNLARMVHLDILIDLKDLDAEYGTLIEDDAGG